MNQQEAKTLKLGDVVYLTASPDIHMTVTTIRKEDGTVFCMYRAPYQTEFRTLGFLHPDCFRLLERLEK